MWPAAISPARTAARPRTRPVSSVVRVRVDLDRRRRPTTAPSGTVARVGDRPISFGAWAGTAPSPAPCDRSACSTGSRRRRRRRAARPAACVIAIVIRSGPSGPAGRAAAGPSRLRPLLRSSPPPRPARRCGHRLHHLRPGRRPIAVSADSINASVPSNTALATSLTSARVGDGAVIMLSSICVAVMTGTPNSTQWRMIGFCRWGTSSSGHSMPRSPRATMIASRHGDDLVEVPDRRQRLDLGDELGAMRPTTSRTAVDVGRGAHERHRDEVDALRRHRSASTRSSSVGVVSRERSDGHVHARAALASARRSRPRRRAVGLDASRPAARSHRRRSRTRSPRAGRRAASGSRRGSTPRAARPSPGTSRIIAPARASTPSSGTAPARTFGPGRSASTPTTCRRASATDAHAFEPADVLVDGAVAEVEPDDVDAGPQMAVEHLGASLAGPSVATIFVRRLTSGLQDLRATSHTCLSSRSMELLLIRHALPVRRELVVGAADPELSEAVRRRPSISPTTSPASSSTRVYASPLRRAVETGAPLAARHGLDVGRRRRRRRVGPHVQRVRPDRGAEGRQRSALAGDVDGRVDERRETRTSSAAACVAAIERSIDAHAGGRIAVVCHGGVINGYLAAVLGLVRPTGLLLSELHVDPPRHGGRTRRALDRHDQRDVAPARHRPADRPVPDG